MEGVEEAGGVVACYVHLNFFYLCAYFKVLDVLPPLDLCSHSQRFSERFEIKVKLDVMYHIRARKAKQ